MFLITVIALVNYIIFKKSSYSSAFFLHHTAWNLDSKIRDCYFMSWNSRVEQWSLIFTKSKLPGWMCVITGQWMDWSSRVKLAESHLVVLTVFFDILTQTWPWCRWRPRSNRSMDGALCYCSGPLFHNTISLSSSSKYCFIPRSPCHRAVEELLEPDSNHSFHLRMHFFPTPVITHFSHSLGCHSTVVNISHTFGSRITGFFSVLS